jgi:hypothetical protein
MLGLLGADVTFTQIMLDFLDCPSTRQAVTAAAGIPERAIAPLLFRRAQIGAAFSHSPLLLYVGQLSGARVAAGRCLIPEA